MTLRILFVSGFFPPHAPIGAVRPGKLAQHWRAAGHDVRVIAIHLPWENGACEQPSETPAYYLGYREPGRLITKLKSGFAGTKQLSAGAIKKKAGAAEFYRQVLLVPDRFRSWIRPAVRLGSSWSPHWQPHLIYSSGPPNSGHIVAAALAKRLAIPWIAEFRDLWANNPYVDLHKLIKPLHHWQAQQTLARAAAFVAVTQQACDQLAATTGKPVVLSYNGYDPYDFDYIETPEPFDSDRVTFLHAGYIYPGRRDPGPLFRAMAGLGEQKHKIRCLFYGETSGIVAAIAECCGVRECVEIHDAISRPEILRLERQVDVLLECHWNDPAGDGVIPGKLFEYIGARRPILSLGSVTGEAAAIVRQDPFGLASIDPAAIRNQLLGWLAQKVRHHRLPDLSGETAIRFQREPQFRKIDALIEETIREAGPDKNSNYAAARR